MSDQKKFCIHCKHYKKTTEKWYYKDSAGRLSGCIPPAEIERDKCTRLQEPHIVTKELVGKTLDCHAERENALRLENFRCGYKGVFWIDNKY